MLLGLALVLTGYLAWRCQRDPKINFLPRDGRAEWILFPAAVEARAYQICSVDTVFRHVLFVEAEPRRAQLTVRAGKRVEIRINGNWVEIDSMRNWKDPATANPIAFLHLGANTIEARVFNSDAPPSLWLTLETEQATLRSDESWEASCTGSAWRRVSLATAARLPHPGNVLAGGETIATVFSAIWRVWVVFALSRSSCRRRQVVVRPGYRNDDPSPVPVPAGFGGTPVDRPLLEQLVRTAVSYRL